MKKESDPKEIVLDTEKTAKGMDTTKLSMDVLRIIVESAAKDVPGIFGMSGGIVDDIAEKLGRKDFTKGIKVTLKGNDVAIEIAVTVEYGYNIVEACNKLKAFVRETVEKTTNLNVTEIIIHVQDVARAYKKQEEEKL